MNYLAFLLLHALLTLTGFRDVEEEIESDESQILQSSQHVAKKGLSLVEKHRRLFEKIEYLDNDIAFLDNEDLHVLDLSDKSSDNYKAFVEEDLYEFENVDVNPDECANHEHIEIKLAYPEEDSYVSDEESKDKDYNNNRGAGVQSRSNQTRDSTKMENAVAMRRKCSGDFNESLKSILDDLDNCLDKSGNEIVDDDFTVDQDVDRDEGETSILSALVDGVPPESGAKAEKMKEYNERLRLKCWKHTDLTPPERLNFCRAVDSVLVTKKRLIDSTEKIPDQTPLHYHRFQEYGNMEKAARSLNYAAGDLGASGFMKFSVVTDENGSTSVVAKPVEVPDKSSKQAVSDMPHTPKVQDVKSTHSKSPKTYFASLNRSGNLSPFIKSIVDKYELFESEKPHFKQFDTEDFQEEELEDSYTMGLLSHQPDIKSDEGCCTGGKDMLNDSSDLADPLVNQMVNNYVYDVIAGGHAALAMNETHFDEADLVTDLNGNLKTEDDISMAVCVDENSVRIVNSKEDLDDNLIQISDSSTLLCMTEGEDLCDVEWNKEPAHLWHSTLCKENDNRNIPKLYPVESRFHAVNEESVPSLLKDRQLRRRRNALATPPETFQKFSSHGSLSCTAAENNFTRHSSSYCRMPFSSNMQPFWFCKDFEESPNCTPGLTKLRSPKRTCSEIAEPVPSLLDIAEKNHLEEFKGKIEAFKAEFPNLSTKSSPLSLDHKSPAKKRRKRSTEQAITDYHYRHSAPNLNTNWNALVQFQYTEDNCNSVETFFTSRFDDFHEDESPSKNVGTTDIIASPGKIDLQYLQNNKPVDENRGSCNKYDFLIRRPVSSSKLECKPLKEVKGFFKNNTDFMNSSCRTEKNKKGSYCPQSSYSATKQSPVKLVRFQKLKEEIPENITLTSESQRKSLKKGVTKVFDILDSFDQYTKNSLQQHCKNNEDMHRNDEDPLKVSRNFLILASLGFKDFELEKVVDSHRKTTDDIVNGNADVSVMLESRNKMYSAISEAVESCSEQLQNVGNCDEVNNSEMVRNEMDQDYSKHEDGCDVTPDVDALMNDLQGLDLSDTPQYVHNETDDHEMHAFLTEALGSLDDIMSASFTSTGSAVVSENKNLQDISIQVNDELNNTVEIQNDSVLNVVGKRCILHESEEVLCDNTAEDDEECVEIFNDPVLTVVGKKCVIHKVDYSLDKSAEHFDGPSPPKLLKRDKETENRFFKEGLSGCGDRLVDIVENVTEESFDRSLIHKATQSSPQEKDISTQTIDCSITDISVEIATQTELEDVNLEPNVAEDNSFCSIQGNSSVDYDEAYDVDGNKIDDCKAAVVADSYFVYERQPTYFCASSSEGYYHTVGELKNDHDANDDDDDDDEEENEMYKDDIPLFEISPIADIGNKEDLPKQDFEDICSTELPYESPDVNFDFEVSKYLEEIESLNNSELNRTRGSSLDTDLTIGIESDAILTEQGHKQGHDVTDDVDDIQSRMQDSGNWLEEFMVKGKVSEIEAGQSQLQESALSEHLPAEFEEKVSFFPNLEVSGNYDDTEGSMQ